MTCGKTCDLLGKSTALMSARSSSTAKVPSSSSFRPSGVWLLAKLLDKAASNGSMYLLRSVGDALVRRPSKFLVATRTSWTLSSHNRKHSLWMSITRSLSRIQMRFHGAKLIELSSTFQVALLPVVSGAHARSSG
eukprot:3706302-Amphidinium_carterae.1